jgi:hypothetical protein
MRQKGRAHRGICECDRAQQKKAHGFGGVPPARCCKELFLPSVPQSTVW